MTPNRPLSEFTRQELHDLIWSTPASKLSADFGISDVAIAKRCRKLNVSPPPRGYWAKVEAGRKPRKPPLPPTPEELFEQAARQPVGQALPLPGKAAQLHPLAVELMQALDAGKLDSQKRTSIVERTLPEASVTKALAERAAQAFHAILQGVEPLGIPFRKAQSSHDSGYFQKGHDRLYLKIEEELAERPQEPGGSTRRRSSWQWRSDARVPSGHLTFSLKTERYGASKARPWTEGDKAPLGELLAQVVTEIRRHYVEAQKRRAQEIIEQEKQRVEAERRWREHQEKEAIRMQEEQKRKYAEGLETTMRNRRDDLLKAAEWWRLHQVTQKFIAACEQRWRNDQADGLRPDQEEWLQWARKTAKALSPFETGYPDPEKDGAFSLPAVPFGGPYPETREFSRPPTMPEIPAPVVVQQGYGAPSHQPAPTPYPFWLKYQR
ncbi:MAG: hypothetical protein QOE70_6262 [Chthoniobacter sp.]|jgi:hypothetical protein|nr:hypothetical protein [Chthoniobacter sp.]